MQAAGQHRSASSHGVDVAQTALWYGADDLDGTVQEETIYHMAGSSTPNAMTTREISRLIRAAVGTADTHVPFPAGEPGKAGALPVVRHAVTNPQQGSAGPNQAGGEAPQVPTEPSATPVSRQIGRAHV